MTTLKTAAKETKLASAGQNSTNKTTSKTFAAKAADCLPLSEVRAFVLTNCVF